MREPNFGWAYPPGAENDPRAPYNQTEEDGDACEICGLEPSGLDGLCLDCARDEADIRRWEERRDRD